MKTGVPVAAFFGTLIGSALFSDRMAAQLRDAAAIATFLLGVAYIVATYVFLVVGGHIIWSLRRQVFEARNLGRYRLKRRLASGGMGDVLTGVCAGLAGRELSMYDAGRVGAWVCGRAAEMSIFQNLESEESLLASNVLANVGGAFNELRNPSV